MIDDEDLTLGDLSRKYHEIAYLRLLDLAAGAQPANELLGICNDLKETFIAHGLDRDIGYLYAGEIFLALGLSMTFPIGSEPPFWEGSNGEKRRALARRMAEYINTTFLR